jgi:tRNA1Val (adenine37-N6)-methyltransferase
VKQEQSIFKFKQFNVDQSGCAMKINTDGVLLGAMSDAGSPKAILDIGTGTGVIALMLAQRFTDAKIDAVEIDESAAETAERNFKTSPFVQNLTVYPSGFEDYFKQFSERKYDLIVSNPPFYIDSLKSPGVKKSLAKHTDVDFFERLFKSIAKHLTPNGCFWLIVPAAMQETLDLLAAGNKIFPRKTINVQSYLNSEAHRIVACFGFDKVPVENGKLSIYKSVNVYADEYKKLLQPYFLAF